mmetsp:Transcript_24263/g.63348  ORF Transcript_24263/g.63348 Transcript_24263/m.63348 type:complete len:221 (+) Transcript_24263:237-899(+)
MPSQIVSDAFLSRTAGASGSSWLRPHQHSVQLLRTSLPVMDDVQGIRIREVSLNPALRSVGLHALHARHEIFLPDGLGLALGARSPEVGGRGDVVVAPADQQVQDVLHWGSGALQPLRDHLDGHDARRVLGEKLLGALEEVALVAFDIDLGDEDGLESRIVLEHEVAGGERHFVLLHSDSRCKLLFMLARVEQILQLVVAHLGERLVTLDGGAALIDRVE